MLVNSTNVAEKLSLVYLRIQIGLYLLDRICMFPVSAPAPMELDDVCEQASVNQDVHRMKQDTVTDTDQVSSDCRASCLQLISRK